MTTFQTMLLEWMGGIPAKVNGLWYRPEEIEASEVLAERLFWAVLA